MNIGLIAHDSKKELMYSFVLHIAGYSAATVYAQQEQLENWWKRQRDWISCVSSAVLRAAISRLQQELLAMNWTFC